MTKNVHIHLSCAAPALLKKTKDAAIFSTYYKTAEVKSSGKFYRVLASNKPTKEETDKYGSLLLQIDDGSKQWQPISNLHAVL